MEFDVLQVIKEKYGRAPIPQLTQVNEWEAWYKGKLDSFHKYTVYNGQQYVTHEKLALGSAKTVCESWANLLVNEKTYVTIPNGNEDEKVFSDDQKLQFHLSDMDFFGKMNEGIEPDFALGGGCFNISLVDGIKNIEAMKFDAQKSQGTIKLEFIDAKKTYILKKRYGEVIDVALVSVGSDEATVTIHKKQDDEKYLITDVIYEKDKSNNWNLVEENKTIVNTPWFSYLKPNKINNIVIGDVQGVSIYSDAIDQLKFCDDAYDGYHNELVLSKKRMFIKNKLTTTVRENGETRDKKIFDVNDAFVYVIPEDVDDEESNGLIKTNDSPLRASDYEKTLNGALSSLSLKCGFGKGYFVYSTDGGGRPLQTATAVISQNSDLYRSLKKHEKNVCKTIKAMVRAICDASQYTEKKISKVYSNSDITVLFDDSIIEDKASEKENARKEVAQGIMSKIEYRMEFFGENEETARQELLKNPDYISDLILKYGDALKSGIITVEKFVDLVYGENVENKQSIIDSITQALKEQMINDSNPFQLP